MGTRLAPIESQQLLINSSSQTAREVVSLNSYLKRLKDVPSLPSSRSASWQNCCLSLQHDFRSLYRKQVMYSALLWYSIAERHQNQGMVSGLGISWRRFFSCEQSSQGYQRGSPESNSRRYLESLRSSCLIFLSHSQAQLLLISLTETSVRKLLLTIQQVDILFSQPQKSQLITFLSDIYSRSNAGRSRYVVKVLRIFVLRLLRQELLWVEVEVEVGVKIGMRLCFDFAELNGRFVCVLLRLYARTWLCWTGASCRVNFLFI